MADTNNTTNTPDLGDKPELGNGKDGSGSYQMRVGFGTIAMLISATGMGLYLVATLCEKMGQGVGLASEEGAGTRVMLAFPHDRRRMGVTKGRG